MTPEVSPRKGRRAGRHFVEHRAEGEQVGAGVEFFAAHLLRRHVGDRAERVPGLVRCSFVRWWLALAGVASGGPCRAVTFARPKSRILAWPRLVTKMLAGLMSRWTMPLVCAASSASAISMARSSRCSRFRSGRPAIAMLQGHALQKFHGDEGLSVVLRRFRRWCRCWDDSEPKRPGLAAEALQRLRIAGQRRRAGTSGRRSDQARCLRPCRPLPCRRRPASRRCGSARWSGRSLAEILGSRPGQVNEGRRVGTAPGG